MADGQVQYEVSLKDGLSTPLHIRPIRGHDREVDDRHEHDKINDGGDECAQVDALSIEGPAESLPGGPSTAGRIDERCDDTVGEGLDQCAERQCHDQTDRDDDQFALHQEVFEAFEHRPSCIRFCAAL